MKKTLHSFTGLIFKNKLNVIKILLIFPLLILLFFFIFLEINQSNLFFLLIFLLNYFLLFFVTLFIFSKIKDIDTRWGHRPILSVVKKLNTTNVKELQDEYKKPLKHLVVAEIGVYDGEYSKQILKKLNIKQLVLVDPWKGWSWPPNVSLEKQRIKGKDDLFYEEAYKKVKNMFADNPKIKIIKDYSVSAAKIFDNEYFDFVDINANRSYESHKADLEAWYPKLKKFGIISGGYGTPNSKYMMQAAIEFSIENRVPIHHGESGEYNFYWFIKI